MKELYTSPEVKLTSFVAVENIASNTIEASSMMGSIAIVKTGDIELSFDLFS